MLLIIFKPLQLYLQEVLLFIQNFHSVDIKCSNKKHQIPTKNTKKSDNFAKNSKILNDYKTRWTFLRQSSPNSQPYPFIKLAIQFYSTTSIPLFQYSMANKDKFLTPFLFTILSSNLIQLLKNEIYT